MSVDSPYEERRKIVISVENLTKKTLAGLLDSTYLKAFGGPEMIDGRCSYTNRPV